MFIKIGEYTINTDKITYAEKQANGITVVYFESSTHKLQLYPNEFEALWANLNPVDSGVE